MGRITATGTAAGLTAVLGAAFAATPASAFDEQFVVVKAGRVITVSGDEIRRGEIVIVDGKVRLVGVGLDYPRDATVIEARDQTVMPGWVHPSSRHGLVGYSRNGVNGDARMEEEVVLETIDFEPFLAAGYTAVALRPGGGGIPGTSAVYRTAGPDDLDPLLGESRVLRAESALRIDMNATARDKNTFRRALAKAEAELEKIAKAREEWEKKQAEAKKKAEEEAKSGGGNGNGNGKGNGNDNGGGAARADGDDAEDAKPEEPETFTPPSTDASHQPLMDWLEGDLAVRPLIELGGPAGLLHLDEVLSSHEDLAANLYLPASGDAVHVVEKLAERDAIILTTMGMSTLTATSTVYNLAGELDAAGADLALTPESIGGGFNRFRGRGRRGGGASIDDATSEMRSARSRLGSLVRAGLSRETAIKAVTLHPAMLLGVETRLGSIEAGKDADLIFLDGDPLDPATSVERVMILGRTVWEKDQ